MNEIEKQKTKVQNYKKFIERDTKNLKQEEIKLASLILGVDLIVGEKYHLTFTEFKDIKHTVMFKKIKFHKFNDGKPEDPLECYQLWFYKPEKDKDIIFELGTIDKIKLLS